ncbi:MAG: protein-L-isoaspartate(D-aspartate) O-methyltransferase [Planctomycetes bacterium]|nr:protein-L-isoaspartate(D-aspartate) O-methyltransferase [Planctomycetota bacterium]
MLLWDLHSAACLRTRLIVVAWIVLVWTGELAPASVRVEEGLGQESAKRLSDPPQADRRRPHAELRRPRTGERAAERRKMVVDQIEARGVKDPAVIEAMRNVPRHWFVPVRLHRLAYADRPLPIGEGQTISQPYIVALMTEVLRLNPQSKVLEIGTGSGYQAAVLSEITPHVFTIEIVEPLARRAIQTFEERGYKTISSRIGDGYGGWPEHAPFDAIIVTCAPEHIPTKLIEQLKPGGRICIPVGAQGRVQELIVATKRADGSLKRKSLIPVRFVPMTGEGRAPPPDGKSD